MLKQLAVVFGIVFVLVGVLGFVPGVTPDGHLLGIFHVNALHNVVHLLSGVIALGVGFAGTEASKRYFQIFGVVYGLVALLGFLFGDAPILGLVANNAPDTGLHLVIAAAALYLGFTSAEPLAQRVRV